MFSVRSIFLPISVGLLFTVVVRLTDGQGLPQNVPPLSTEVNFNGANFDGLNVQTPATNQQNQTADSGQNKAKSGPPIPDATTISNVTRQGELCFAVKIFYIFVNYSDMNWIACVLV